VKPSSQFFDHIRKSGEFPRVGEGWVAMLSIMWISVGTQTINITGTLGELKILA
jgi:hypothetical protein